MADVELAQVAKTYGGLQVIHGVDLKIRSGEFVVFVGPSGCGKSTLLRMIAGLEAITGGEVSIGGRVVNDMPSSQRGIAMVFQSYALYPHMTVRANMAFGLELARTPKPEIEARVLKAARILQLEPYLDRMPKALSGGQRQRVAIGRAIVRQPKVFLFDEPLSNLDSALRGQTRIELARLHAQLGATMIYVTHDQVEAMTLADRIVVLNAGRIEQVGTPLELYRSPANAFVAGFIGGQTMNLLPAEAKGGRLSVLGRDLPIAAGPGVATLGMRPEHLRPCDPAAGHLSGRVEVVEEFGEHALVHLDLGGQALTVKVGSEVVPKIGEDLGVQVDPGHFHLFDAKGRALR